MVELAMLADIQRTVYPEEVTRQLHVMAQARESSPVVERRFNQLCYAAELTTADRCVVVDLAALVTSRKLL